MWGWCAGRIAGSRQGTLVFARLIHISMVAKNSLFEPGSSATDSVRLPTLARPGSAVAKSPQTHVRSVSPPTAAALVLSAVPANEGKFREAANQ